MPASILSDTLLVAAHKGAAMGVATGAARYDASSKALTPMGCPLVSGLLSVLDVDPTMHSDFTLVTCLAGALPINPAL